MVIRIGASGLQKAILVSVIFTITPLLATEILEFYEPATTTVVLGPSLHWEVTYIAHEAIPLEVLWDSTPPCLSDLTYTESVSCYVGTVTFQPPRIALPPGSTIVADGPHGLWAEGAVLNISGLPVHPRTSRFGESFTAEYQTPTGHFSRDFYAGDFFGLDPGSTVLIADGGFFDYPVDLLRTAASSTGLLPPVTVDIRLVSFVNAPYPVEWERGPVPEGTTVSFSGDITWTNSTVSLGRDNLVFQYETANIPEPSTAALLLLGVAAFALNRIRRRRPVP